MKFLKGCLMLGGGLFGLLLMVGLFVGNSDGPQEVQADQTNPSLDASSDASRESDTIALNSESAISGDRSIVVTGSEVVDYIPSDNQFTDPVEAKGGKLVVVYMTLSNTGSDSGNTFFTDFNLVDSQEREYDTIEDLTESIVVDTWAESKGLGSNGDQLFPGASVDVLQVFRVAPDADALKLFVRNKKFDIK